MEIRREIFYFILGSDDDFFLDKQVINLAPSLQTDPNAPGHGRLLWRRATADSLISLLVLNRQIHEEVERTLYARFAFSSQSWGIAMRFSDPAKDLTRLPKHHIQHLVYQPRQTEYLAIHQQNATLLLAGLPKLCSVRVMVGWDCAQELIYSGGGSSGSGVRSEDGSESDGANRRAGSSHIVAVARLFSAVGKVAVIGQSLGCEAESALVEEARRELQDEKWYWELPSGYAWITAGSSAGDAWAWL